MKEICKTLSNIIEDQRKLIEVLKKTPLLIKPPPLIYKNGDEIMIGGDLYTILNKCKDFGYELVLSKNVETLKRVVKYDNEK